MRIANDNVMGEFYIKPILRIDLDAIYEQIPMDMGTGYPTGGTDLTNALTGLYMIANGDINLCLVVKTAINPVAMVNDRDITSYNLKTGIYDNTRRRGIDIEWV
jgi:hypothetical protein